MNLYGEILPPTKLRFNSSLRFAIDSSPSTGIRKFGPYDASLFAQNRISCGVIYPAEMQKQKEALTQGLINGEGSSFPGFTALFRAPISFDPSSERRVKSGNYELRQAAESLAAKNCDLVFIVTPQRNEQAYRECKSVLLNNGVPCQFVTAANLQNPSQRPWVLGNIALASYAKVGGTPWVVADSSGRHELVMGVSRAQEETNKKFVVGFVTLFNQEGDFLLLHSKTPVVRWDDYVKGLEDLVSDAYREYEERFSAPESLVIHFHKRPGEKELEAINSALKRLGRTIPYALVHLNEFSAFRLFDTTHSSHVPTSGLTVKLSRRRALLLLDGRENSKRNRMGTPNVWDISLDKRSTIDLDEFPRLVSQIQRFAKVNWRGFNAKSLPATLNYSQLICHQVLEIGVDSWNMIVGNGKLREKAWFL